MRPSLERRSGAPVVPITSHLVVIIALRGALRGIDIESSPPGIPPSECLILIRTFSFGVEGKYENQPCNCYAFHREFPITAAERRLASLPSRCRVTQRCRARLTTMKMFRAARRHYRRLQTIAPPRAASHIYHYYYRYRILLYLLS